MPSARFVACAVAVSLVMTGVAAFAVDVPPTTDYWQLNKDVRHDLRPLHVNTMPQQPVINGMIEPGEWRGAVQYEVYGDPDVEPGMMIPMSMDDPPLLGMLYAGLFDGYLYMANDWTINDSPDPLLGGANAWRFGTSTGPGAENSGLGEWYEIYVQDDGDQDIVMARQAANEADLDDPSKPAEFRPGVEFGISAGAYFKPGQGQEPGNWQYELFLSQSTNPGEGPGPLPYCWHWEWQQLDPRPSDGAWIPVYDGSVHNHPEPATMLLLGGGLLALARRRRRK
jgi:hypothetical protein